jgi:hypothetical protein
MILVGMSTGLQGRKIFSPPFFFVKNDEPSCKERLHFVHRAFPGSVLESIIALIRTGCYHYHFFVTEPCRGEVDRYAFSYAFTGPYRR